MNNFIESVGVIHDSCRNESNPKKISLKKTGEYFRGIHILVEFSEKVVIIAVRQVKFL